MMSLLAMAGFALGGIGDVDDSGNTGQSDDEYLFEHDEWAQTIVPVDALPVDVSHFEQTSTPAQTPVLTPAETVDLARGDAISSFNPRVDLLELEYTAAMGMPEVTIMDFADGSGASIALNGVVVADVAGAQGLDPGVVSLIAV